MEADMPSFLVGYDYGMGGVWGFVDSPSEAEIRRIYPELKIFHEKPHFMKEASYMKIRSEAHVDVYGPPEGILKAVVGARVKTSPEFRGKDLGR
jgi:hypothetical protein